MLSLPWLVCDGRFTCECNGMSNNIYSSVSSGLPAKLCPAINWSRIGCREEESVHVDCLRGPLEMQHATNTHLFSFATHQSTLDKSLDLDPTLSGSRNRQHGSAVKFTCLNALAVCPIARDERNRRGRTQQHYEKHESLARPSL
jgi:hypothetical protein